MELIAASRIVKAQARVHAAQPYADGITEVVRDLQAAGGGSEQSAARAARRDPHASRTSSSRPTADCAAATTPRDPRRGERRCASTSRSRTRRRRSSRSAARPRATSASATSRSTPSFAGFSDSPTYEDARAVAAAVVDRFEAGELDLVAARLHALHLGRPPRSRRASRCCRSTDDEGSTRGDGRRPSEPSADYEFEPSPDAILDTLLPRYAEVARLRRAAERGRVGARGPPARDEGRDRQRRRPDPHVPRRMNRARQDSITTEIMEIVGGAEALEPVGRRRRRASDAEYYDKSA